MCGQTVPADSFHGKPMTKNEKRAQEVMDKTTFSPLNSCIQDGLWDGINPTALPRSELCCGVGDWTLGRRRSANRWPVIAVWPGSGWRGRCRQDRSGKAEPCCGQTLPAGDRCGAARSGFGRWVAWASGKRKKLKNGNTPIGFLLGLVALLSSAVAVAVAGCAGGSDIYTEPKGDAPGSVSPKASWAAVGDVVAPGAAIDGDIRTGAIAQGDYAGRSIAIDLRKACMFQTVVIDHGGGQDGYAAEVELAASVNGRRFDVKYVTVGTRRVTILSLPTPTMARYIRIRATRVGGRSWRLAEVYVQ